MAITVKMVPGSGRKTTKYPVGSKNQPKEGNYLGKETTKPWYNPRTDQGITQEQWEAGQKLAVSKENSSYAPNVVQEQAQQPGVLGPGQFKTKEEALAYANSDEFKTLTTANLQALDTENKPKKSNLQQGVENLLINPQIKENIQMGVNTIKDVATGNSSWKKVGETAKKSAVNQAILVGEAALIAATMGASKWLSTMGITGKAAAAISEKAATKINYLTPVIGGEAATEFVTGTAAKAAAGTAAKGAAGAAAKAAGNELIPAARGLVGSMAGKTILGMSVPLLVGAGGFTAYSITKDAIGADSQANWMMMDNAKGSLGMTLNTLYSNIGNMSPEERAEAVEAVDQAYALRDMANAKIETSARYNPYTMAQKKAWTASGKATDDYITLLGELIKNYNPELDYRSLEYKQAQDKKQLQTYGKPKYDEEGNRL